MSDKEKLEEIRELLIVATKMYVLGEHHMAIMNVEKCLDIIDEVEE